MPGSTQQKKTQGVLFCHLSHYFLEEGSVTEPELAVCKGKQSFVSVPTVVGLLVLSQI